MAKSPANSTIMDSVRAVGLPLSLGARQSGLALSAVSAGQDQVSCPHPLDFFKPIHLLFFLGIKRAVRSEANPEFAELRGFARGQLASLLTLPQLSP